VARKPGFLPTNPGRASLTPVTQILLIPNLGPGNNVQLSLTVHHVSIGTVLYKYRLYMLASDNLRDAHNAVHFPSSKQRIVRILSPAALNHIARVQW
jgi:hypothetical protein